MKLHIGGDHAAFALKTALVDHLRAAGHDVVDHGPLQETPGDDYPRFVIPAAQAVAAEPGALGIVLGGSGNGEQIAANKVAGIRAILAHTVETARLGREHNDAQVIAIGARMTPVDLAIELVDAFVATPFSEVDRHVRRLAQVSAYERDGVLPD
ncbi:MAG: ribose-5-phosphate isomerase [Austwickia sp.]|jgi:ribose 5-phosphate isomerase B|nr:ribose-5-phosphate isomerase [Austwickia sp.]MBK8434966.1 ribose-5-phosphate isomerase [Austwickia sp.]MBK9101476.1 ribose-5-phosphate isomerase [Austwickia sp.]